MSVGFGREILGDLQVAETREWLITNGIGGYGSGTVAGSITRGYHGLLVAALRPPSTAAYDQLADEATKQRETPS